MISPIEKNSISVYVRLTLIELPQKANLIQVAVNSSAIISACFKTVSVANFCISGGYPYYLNSGIFYNSSFDIAPKSKYNRLKSYNNSEVKKMNKHDLIIKLADKEGLSQSDSKSVIDLVFDDMERALIKGDRVEIRGFGTFKVKEYPGYLGRNPKTGARTKVGPKKLPFFKVGKDLKERVDIQ